MQKTNIKIAALIGAAFIIVNLPGLDRSPLVWIDEAICNDPARELAFHGRLRSSVQAENRAMGEAYFFLPPGQPLITAAVYKIFGFGIMQTRTPVVIFGGAAIAMLFLVSIELFRSRRAAVLAALLYALDPKVIQVARSGRMDMQCHFFILLGLLLLLHARASQERRALRLGLSGLGVGIAGVTHPIAVFWALGLGIIILTQTKRDDLALFGLGAGLPCLCWLMFALQTPDLFIDQFIHHGKLHLTGGGLFQRYFSELMRYPQAYTRLPLLLPACIGGLGWLAFSKKPDQQVKLMLLMLFIVLFSLNSLVMVKSGGYYYLHPTIIMALAAGAMLDAILPENLRRPGTMREWAALAVVILVLGNELAAGLFGRWLALACQWQARGYARVEQGVAAIIPPGSVIIGPAQVWYAAAENGSELHIARTPDPAIHDFVIFDAAIRVDAVPGFVKAGEMGAPLPPVLGRFKLSDYDYHLQVWKSVVRHPQTGAP